MAHSPPIATQDSFSPNERFGFGLTEMEVRRLRDIMRRESHVDLTLEHAWERAIELLSFTKMLLESLPPKEG